MSGNTLLSRLVCFGSALAITSCTETPTQPTLPIVLGGVPASKDLSGEDNQGGTALFFNCVFRRILAYLGLSHSGQGPGPAPPEPSAATP